MRVTDRNLAANAQAEAAKAQEAQRIERAGTQRSGSTGGSEGGDQVQLSSLAGRVSNAIQTSSTDRSSRVQALAAAYQSGSYQSDAGATSSAMVSETLAASMK
jgi:anti-sigma28 factor (negative regulator of flagellin synthesis)